MSAIDFFDAAPTCLAERHDLELPALALGVPRVHAIEIGGEQRRFVAAGAGANLDTTFFSSFGSFGSSPT